MTFLLACKQTHVRRTQLLPSPIQRHIRRLAPHCHSKQDVFVCGQEEEEGIGDVDLFTLSDDRTKLSVNVKWLQHLQVMLFSAHMMGKKL